MMQTKPGGRLSWAVFLAVVAAAVVGVPDVSSGAPAPPPPMMPCIRAAGKCLDTNIVIPADDGQRSNPGDDGDTNPPPSDGGDTRSGPPRPPTPEEINRQVQRDLLLEAETFLPQPEVATYPGEGRPSIIDVPTFFAVTNWLPRQVDHFESVGAGGAVFTVTVTATPSLSLDPGEQGAPTIQCEDGGTRFDPNGPSPDEQASRPGACAHSYTRRTGVAGRPDHWTARLIVSWTIDWDANFPIPPDIADDLVTFDTLTEEVVRPVDEITSVVNGRS